MVELTLMWAPTQTLRPVAGMQNPKQNLISLTKIGRNINKTTSVLQLKKQ